MQLSLLPVGAVFGFVAGIQAAYIPPHAGLQRKGPHMEQDHSKSTSYPWANSTWPSTNDLNMLPTPRIKSGIARRAPTEHAGFMVPRPLLLNPAGTAMSYREFQEPLRAYIPEGSAIVVKNENGNLWVEPAASVATINVTQTTTIPTSTGNSADHSDTDPVGPEILPQTITDSTCLKHFLGINTEEPAPESCTKVIKRAIRRHERRRTYRTFGSHEREGQDASISPLDHSSPTWQNHTLTSTFTGSPTAATEATALPTSGYGRQSHPGWYNRAYGRHSRNGRAGKANCGQA
ncbi:hypothetical protein CFIMG_007908RA00001 [Ceratocystis fimbriata CBS 114723]|uniref:Uncharacterized protein n=1 Tax=Ceratocystis fimbriata CBS 114723 TaxID=1035309 RepID=A0A2C5WTI6_9PEZI|nr:hypothetical protein CFIMG_007908RA00001 [Ceratocystis fimbriata CBS 114723]